MIKNFWKNFETKIVIIILLIILSLSVSIYMVAYKQTYALTIANLKDDARIVHQYAEGIISEDSFIQLNTIGDESKEVYRSTHKQLDEIRQVANIRYLYTAKQNAAGEYIYVLDGLDPSADDFRHVGDLIEPEIIPALVKCLNDEVVLGDRIMNTDWGIIYVTYFPVHDTAGNVIGAIGMEFDCENLYHSLGQAAVLTFIITALIVFICVGVAIVMLKQLIKRTESVLEKKDRALIQAKEEALKSSNAKSDFLSRMSHEIRTPMNAIIGMTAIAEGTSDLSKITHCLSTIKASSTQLLGLINDILDMSKIEAGKFELSMQPFNIEKVLTKVCSLVTDAADRKKQQFDVEMDSRIGLRYIGDELRIAQVLTNLLSNAVKFTPENGRVCISVKQMKKEDTQTTVLFCVSDTGIGMSGKQLDALFLPFEQADTSISRKFGGTGLGLAISKSIVEKMGGKIWVESEIDKGSVFYVELTLKNVREESVSHSVEDRQAKAEDTASQEDTPDFSRVRLLLVEDIAINREIVISLLEDTHITIETAENGRIAVERFTDEPDRYNLILMDIQMPEMDGYEAAKTIRSLDILAAKTVPIIAMTANAFKEDIDKCLAAGMNDHLAKPIDFSEVVRKIAMYSRR
jgi:signal transduction histidine kinase